MTKYFSSSIASEGVKVRYDRVEDGKRRKRQEDATFNTVKNIFASKLHSHPSRVITTVIYYTPVCNSFGIRLKLGNLFAICQYKPGQQVFLFSLNLVAFLAVTSNKPTSSFVHCEYVLYPFSRNQGLFVATCFE